ncbi:hypothetical protein BCF74_10331 [Knoellia remsis]|uniref:Uncharacterized protein n=1 Tax=Knoellia remsis TaxID=407159 RepID=A0A2T0UY63_9MICO|nr:hypothetical protein [Knoellia remsis]PRY62824.1 hypothetical protein BCF74_10331 [Knoellia remsis]
MSTDWVVLSPREPRFEDVVLAAGLAHPELTLSASALTHLTLKGSTGSHTLHIGVPQRLASSLERVRLCSWLDDSASDDARWWVEVTAHAATRSDAAPRLAEALARQLDGNALDLAGSDTRDQPVDPSTDSALQVEEDES